MRGAYGNTLAAGCATAAQHRGAGFSLHARPESVRLRAVAAVRLKGSFGHGYPLLFSKENLLFSNSLSISQAIFSIHPPRFHDVARVKASSSYPQKGVLEQNQSANRFDHQ